MKIVNNRGKKLENIPEEKKEVKEEKVIVTENRLNHSALDYIDDLFAQQELDDKLKPDLKIENENKVIASQGKKFSEDVDKTKILEKSVLKKKVRFEEEKVENKEDNDFISGYEADNAQMV